MNELVERLSRGRSVVEFEQRTKTLEELKQRLDSGFVFITFLETRGETELGINIDRDLTDLSKVDFDKGVGIIQISGTCILNYQKVRCTAYINLATRKGEGQLIPLNEHDIPNGN